MLTNLAKPVLVLTIVLGAQAALFHARSTEATPPAKELSTFPRSLGNWSMLEEGVVEQEVRDVLQADDLLSRGYYNSSTSKQGTLFVAYFHSQRSGKAPHSPKNCLPGSGWLPSQSGFLKVPVENGTIEVNQYVVSKGDHRSVVLYWYQTAQRVVASEYRAKAFLVLDSMRLNRSDTAMVRIVVPVERNASLDTPGDPELQTALQSANDFAKSVYPAMTPYLPVQ